MGGPALVVFADVDGILRDPRRRCLEAGAATLLHLLSREGAPVVLSSGKTRAELEWSARQLGLIGQPIIAESGAALFVPPGCFDFPVPHARQVAGYQAVEFGRPYASTVERLHDAARRAGVGIVAFSDMSVEEVATECNVSLLEARLAKLREYDELFRPVHWDWRSRQQLFKALQAEHLAVGSHAGYCRVGAPVDWGATAAWLAGLYRQAMGPVITVGLGNAPSHAPLLRAVDVPVIVAGEEPETTRSLLAECPAARLTGGDGLKGWPEIFADLVGRERHVGSVRA